jgi:hypothetical protein
MVQTDRGDGPPCPEPGEHGRTYSIVGMTGTEFWWCPVSQELFAVNDGGHGIGPALRVKLRVAAVHDGELVCVGLTPPTDPLTAIDLKEYE